MTKSAFDAIKHHNYMLPEPKFWGRRTGHSRLHIRVSKPEVGGFELYTKEQVIEMLNAAYGR